MRSMAGACAGEWPQQDVIADRMKRACAVRETDPPALSVHPVDMLFI